MSECIAFALAACIFASACVSLGKSGSPRKKLFVCRCCAEKNCRGCAFLDAREGGK